VYAIHGIRVPRSVVENPESITFGAIEQERNAEDRRVMLERYGWDRYLADCRSQVVDAVPEDHPILGLRAAATQGVAGRARAPGVPGDAQLDAEA
jgi:hypothetical protein